MPLPQGLAFPQGLASPQTPGQGQQTRLAKRTLQGQLKFPITKQGGATDKGVTLPLTPPYGSDDEPCETPGEPDTCLGNDQLISPPDTPSLPLTSRFKRIKLSDQPPTENRCLSWSVKPQVQYPRLVTLEKIDPKIFARICYFLQPVEQPDDPKQPQNPHYIYLPHFEDGRREILRRCPTAFSSVPGTSPHLEPPDDRYRTMWFSRTIFKFDKLKDDSLRRRAWLLLGVSRTLRSRYINEIFSKQKYIVNMLDLHHFAFLATTPPPMAEEGEAKNKQVQPLPQLPFRNVSVFVPAGEKLPQLPLQPFYALEKAGISVNLVCQEAEEHDPAMVATIKKAKDFMADYARQRKTLPVEYDNVHVFRAGDLYVKPSWAYLKKYRLGRIPRNIFRQQTSGLKLHDLRNDLRPLHTLTGSTVWLDMSQNIYNEEYEYLDPSKGYDEQSAIECERYDHIGSCVERSFYTKDLGNHFILREETFSTFNTHLINCIHIPLRKRFSRRSYIRLFHPADDDNRADPDEMRTRLYELLNNRGVHQCGMCCRESRVLGLEKQIEKGQLTLEKLQAAISSFEREGDVAWGMYNEFCLTAKEKARRAKTPPSNKGKKVREPSPEPDSEYDKDEAWKDSEYETSDEEKGADEEMAEETMEIDSKELDEMWKEADISRWKPLAPFKQKRIVPRPPKGCAPIVLEAWHDTSLLPEIKVDEDDESSDDSDEERYKILDREYYDDKRWKASEWAESESEDSDPEADNKMCPPITADEIAGLRIDDDGEDTEKKKPFISTLSLCYSS